jgi:hypothetical protein
MMKSVCNGYAYRVFTAVHTVSRSSKLRVKQQHRFSLCHTDTHRKRCRGNFGKSRMCKRITLTRRLHMSLNTEIWAWVRRWIPVLRDAAAVTNNLMSDMTPFPPSTSPFCTWISARQCALFRTTPSASLPKTSRDVTGLFLACSFAVVLPRSTHGTCREASKASRVKPFNDNYAMLRGHCPFGSPWDRGCKEGCGFAAGRRSSVDMLDKRHILLLVSVPKSIRLLPTALIGQHPIDPLPTHGS